MDDFFTRVRKSLPRRYSVTQRLGSGATCVVFLAQDLEIERNVAIKVLRPTCVGTRGADRFVREMWIAARLRHPYIVPLYERGNIGDLPYYVTPYIDGETLRYRLEREKRMSLEAAFGVARCVATALDYVHEEGVIHRDVKPENILLDKGHALIADFGIALADDLPEELRSITGIGVSIGTPPYMSPEQACGEPVCRRSDQYTLACVVYEMLLGFPPFVGTMREVMAQHVSATPSPTINHRGEVGTGVSAAIARALAKAPLDRFGSAMEFVLAMTGGKRPGAVTPSVA